MTEILIFSGGRNVTDELYTTELYRNGLFSPGMNLMNDVPRTKGCLAQIDSSSFVIVGGKTNTGFDRACMKHDIKAGIWTDLPKPTHTRASFPCGHLDGKNTI